MRPTSVLLATASPVLIGLGAGIVAPVDPMRRILLTIFLLTIAPPAQERLWEVYSTRDAYTYVATFGDFDRDGADDVLSICWRDYGTFQQYLAIRILSGVNGSVLQERVAPDVVIRLTGVGDFDRDGYPDYLGAFGSALSEIWSPHLQQQLMQFRPLGGHGGYYAYFGGGDLNGDSLSDVVIASGGPIESIVAYDHYGNLLYSTPIAQWGIGPCRGVEDRLTGCIFDQLIPRAQRPPLARHRIVDPHAKTVDPVIEAGVL